MHTDILPQVSIILLNYQGADDTIACLKSLQKITYPNYRIVVVDNASPDDSMEQLSNYLKSQNSDEMTVFDSPDEAMLSSHSPTKFSLLQTGHNGGYGHGNNVGIKYALKNGGDYVLVLNNDTVVDPGFLEPMVQMCENDSSIGIASGKIYFYDRPDVIWFNGGKFHPCTAKVEHVNFNEKDTGQIPPEEITFISGCMWLIPKKIFVEVGYINEDYFMYVEDLEFCQRVMALEYKLEICQLSHVWHKVGSSSGHWSTFFAYWMAKNKMRFITNFLKGKCRLSAIIYHVFYTSLGWILHNRYDLFVSHLKGILHMRKDA